MKEQQVELKLLTTEDDIKKLAKLAKEIWEECFIDIISKEQIDYMVEKFQSEKAIKNEIENENYLYYALAAGNEFIGYTAVAQQENKLLLSKVYLKKEHRGRGYSSILLNKAEEVAVLKNLNSVYLVVNKNNKKATEVYLNKGYKIKGERVKDIGNGFVMDDYICEKEL